MVATYVDAIDTVDLLIKIGDGGSPETFAHPCGINTSRGVQFSAEASTNMRSRCDDPTRPGKMVRTVTSTDSSISGEGTLHASSAKTYADWLRSGQPKNITAQVGSAAGALVVAGPYLLTAFSITGSGHGSDVTASMSFAQADEPAVTAHA